MSRFVHLHTHSHYSLLDGLAKIDELVDRAQELKMPALAITDHGNVYGAIEFYQKARKAGIKPILGVEAYVAPRTRQEKIHGVDNKYFHLTLLCKDNIGWKNLIQLVTKANLEGFYYKPRVDKELLRQHSEGLIALSGCYSGELIKSIIADKLDEAEKIINEHKEIFGADNYYIEIGHHPGIDPENFRKVRAALVDLSQRHNLPLVAAQDVHYLNKEDAPYHDILLAVQTASRNNKMSLRGDDFSLRSGEEMAECFKDIPEAIENTVKIADRCNVKLELGKPILPRFPIDSGETPATLLRRLVKEKIARHYNPVTDDIQQRIDFELSVIEKMDYPTYFLIVQDFINWAKERKIVVGPGRGSAAGSVVSYILGITNVDPLEHDLLFERFLNPDRIQMPDIDVDIADARRDEVVGYLREKYGENHVANIITFGTMAARAAIRDTGRALGVSYGSCDKIAKLIPFNKDLGFSLENIPELKEMYERDEEVKKVVDAAKHLEGVARHASVHACGIVISDKPLTEYLPLQYAPQDENTILTQFEMHAVEDLGLLKMDILGLKNLTIMEGAARLVKENSGEEIDVNNLPQNDPKTFAMLQQGDTTGVFQFECLSGDAIVSNTTIKKLFEKRHKKTLNSVYIDEGKVHKNQIIDVIKSGKKQVYALIAENDWYVKATKNHNFLTINGWKKLSDIKLGDQVLMKLKAKHLVYNSCKTCGIQINGQKDGKGDFCYTCSARFYSNPSKIKSKIKMKAARKKFFDKGGTTWNQGLTATNNEIWAQTAKKISQSLMGRTWENVYGKERAMELRKTFSKKMSGGGNPMFGKSPPHRNRGFRKDLGHYVRSNWEADFARILNLQKIKYEYEPKTFKLTTSDGRVVSYTPDFYTPSTNTFYEIKGWMRDIDQEKIDLFVQQYPYYNFALINTTKFAELSLRYKHLVAWECPRIPIDQGFNFVPIKEIRNVGEEETYDIAMKSPGNNFVANGFVVHNSSGMRRFMKELKPDRLGDLIALAGLYRPGPIDLIPSFIRRKHGQEQVTYLHPELEPIMRETYGIAIYQEQIMRIARDLAGYTPGEADVLRKAVGKKIKSLLDEQKVKIISGLLKNGIAEPIAKAIWELFPPFANYGFNKSHSTCYAIIAYQTAYLRAHYPVEFMTSLLNCDSGDTERVAFLVSECKKMGIEVLPPNINRSFEKFITDGHNIRFGLLAVKNVGKNIVEAIIENRRKEGEFKKLSDLLGRVHHKDLNKKSLESLVKCGAFDSVSLERNMAIENIDEILKFSSALRKYKQSNQAGLFGGKITGTLNLRPVQPADTQTKLAWEKELLGLYISDHPLNIYREKLAKTKPIKEALLVKNERTAFAIGGIVTRVHKIITKSNQPMLFAKIEDFGEAMEIVVFPSALEQNAFEWEEGKAALVMGRMSWRNNEPKFICNSVEAL
ncbi:MAG: DNA polymerase III subunit alpha [Patescibacteria group bacterium]